MYKQFLRTEGIWVYPKYINCRSCKQTNGLLSFNLERNNFFGKCFKSASHALYISTIKSNNTIVLIGEDQNTVNYFWGTLAGETFTRSGFASQIAYSGRLWGSMLSGCASRLKFQSNRAMTRRRIAFENLF